MGLSLLGGIKIEKLSRPCEFNFQTLQSAYTIPTCGRNQKSSKSPPLNHNVPTVVETQFLYLFINLFWVISVNLFFPGKVWGLWAKFFSPLIRVSPTNTLTFSSSFYRFPPPFPFQGQMLGLNLNLLDREPDVHFKIIRARLVYVFKNWKLLFENICGNTCGWKSALKCVKCCLKTENSCLKSQTKHPLINSNMVFFFFFFWR